METWLSWLCLLCWNFFKRKYVENGSQPDRVLMLHVLRSFDKAGEPNIIFFPCVPHGPALVCCWKLEHEATFFTGSNLYMLTTILPSSGTWTGRLQVSKCFLLLMESLQSHEKKSTETTIQAEIDNIYKLLCVVEHLHHALFSYLRCCFSVMFVLENDYQRTITMMWNAFLILWEQHCDFSMKKV